jgi:hypothetical protein
MLMQYVEGILKMFCVLKDEDGSNVKRYVVIEMRVP